MFRRTLLTLVFMIIGLMAAASVGAVPQSPGGVTSYSCDPAGGGCTCQIDRNGSDCRDLLNSGQCVSPEGLDPWTDEAVEGGLSWANYVNCNHTTGVCTCDQVVDRASPDGTSSLPDVFGTYTLDGQSQGLETYEEPTTPTQVETQTDEEAEIER